MRQIFRLRILPLVSQINIFLFFHFLRPLFKLDNTRFSEKKAEPEIIEQRYASLSPCLYIFKRRRFVFSSSSFGETPHKKKTKIWRSWASIRRRRLRKRLLRAGRLINNNRRTTTTITTVSSTRCRKCTTNTSNSRILNTLIIRCTTHNRDSCIIRIIIRSGTYKEEHSFPRELESGIGCARTVAGWCFPARRTVSGVECWSLPDRYVYYLYIYAFVGSVSRSFPYPSHSWF